MIFNQQAKILSIVDTVPHARNTLLRQQQSTETALKV
jgi:hypothetical protein